MRGYWWKVLGRRRFDPLTLALDFSGLLLIRWVKAIEKYYKAGNITREEIRVVNSFGIALKQVFVENMIILFDLKRQVLGASKLEACEVFGMPVD